MRQIEQRVFCPYLSRDYLVVVVSCFCPPLSPLIVLRLTQLSTQTYENIGSGCIARVMNSRGLKGVPGPMHPPPSGWLCTYFNPRIYPFSEKYPFKTNLLTGPYWSFWVTRIRIREKTGSESGSSIHKSTSVILIFSLYKIDLNTVSSK